MNLFLTKNDVVFTHFTKVETFMAFGCGHFYICFTPLVNAPLGFKTRTTWHKFCWKIYFCRLQAFSFSN